MTPEALVLVEIHGRVGLVRLNRPRQMNALSSPLMKELMDALAAFDANDEIGAMVITGDERAFAAGADIREMASATAMDMLEWGLISEFGRFKHIRKPVIAAVSGYCLGGGNELAMCCDLIVASETARFGQPEINIGVIPGAGGTQRLPRAVGKAVAMEMILNNRTLTAQEALQLGLVNRVVSADQFLEEALSLAAEIANRAPLALRLAKQAILQAYEAPLSEGLTDEQRLFYLLFATQDQKEGMSAFLEKRPPQWKGA